MRANYNEKASAANTALALFPIGCQLFLQRFKSRYTTYMEHFFTVSIGLTLTHISKKRLRNVSETSSYHNDII